MPGETNNRTANFSVTSSLVNMFDENSNQLRLAGYDSGMQIGIWEPAVSPEGKMTFPKEKRHVVVVQQEYVAVLKKLIEEHLIDKIRSNVNFKIGIQANRSATNIIDIIHQDGDVYLRLNIGLNADKIAKETVVYKFPKNTIIVGYNPQDGSFDVEQIDAQFALFANTVSAYSTFTMVAGHGSRVQMDFTMNRMYRYLQAVATKLGVTIDSSYGTSGAGYSGNGAPEQYSGPVTEVSDINKLLMS